MLLTLTLLIIASNAVAEDKNKSIIYSRMVIQGLILTFYISYNNLFLKPLEKGIGLYGSMFNITTFSQSFNLFIIFVVSVIMVLTAFYPRIISSISVVNENSKNTERQITLEDKLNENNDEKVKTVHEYMSKIVASNKLGQFSIIEYALIILFVLSGAIFLISTGDLISMFLSIELQSYGLYILCTLHRDSESSTSSGLTYFLLGGMSSCFILFGSALLYVNTGTTSLDNIYLVSSLSEIVNASNSYLNADVNNTLHGKEGMDLLYKSHYIGISLIIMIVGFLFKVSAAPFHFWSPDVYDGIPTVVTTFVAIVAKISIFAFILQLILNIDFNFYLYDAGSVNDEFYIKWKNILIFSSFMSLIIGSVLGLTQYRIKRLFAYSTISHVGFILLALSVGTIESIQGYIFYILQYTVSNLNAFFILIIIGFTINYKVSNKNRLTDLENSPVQLISQLKGYFYINSFISISLAITLFSFVGVPPLIGFFAKQMVLSAALDEGFVFITLVAVITSVIGAVYYLNVIKTIFFSDNSESKGYNFSLSSNNNIYITDLNKLSGENVNNINLYYLKGNVSINSVISMSVSILTMVILTFMCTPNEWLRVASLLSVSLFKI